MDTFHKDYNAMTNVIKEEVVEVVKAYQAKGDHELDIVEFWSDVQSKIFTSVAVGRGNTNIMCDYELSDGTVVRKPLGDLIRHLLEDTINRIRNIIFSIFPELAPYAVTAVCRRYKRNVASVRNAIQQIIDDRRAGKTKSTSGENDDLLAILLSSELYRGDDEKTKDELIIFFLAGNETIKTSSTNTVCYLTQLPEMKKRFMDEITSVLDGAKEDFVDKLTMDDVENFDFVRRCWNESMRLQPPAPGSSTNCFSKTIKIKGVDFTPKTGFVLNFDAIHKDPKEWIDPLTFNPDRFDPTSKMYLRPDGQMRNPFSFCPFFGGKRICLGKTLAEFMTVFTLPLVMYHFDFEFVNPEHMKNKPNFQLATFKTPVIPMKMRSIRKLN